jgi:alpha,alpha-trehalose phosphorylase
VNHITSDPLDRRRFPVDEWALIEDEYHQGDEGRTETVFAVGNGYLGLRGNPDEGRGGHSFGTFINGFHETWPIRHAEEAFGFARVGQTIVNVPDAKVIRLYVDDEPFVLFEADILRHCRRLDFRDGVLRREIEWRTPSGKRVLVTSRRLVSFEERHLAVIEYEVTVLDADASLLISSQILNRQDMGDEYHAGMRAAADAFDPRRAESFEDRVLQPELRRNGGSRAILGYRTTNSGMTLAVGADHDLDTENEWDESSQIDADIAKHVYRVRAKAGKKVTLTKTITYHTSRGVPPRDVWPTAATAPSTASPTSPSTTSSRRSAPGSTTTGPAATSRSPTSPRSSRPSAGTSSSSPRRRPAPTDRASRPRASRARVTAVTTSGTPRSTCCRS